MVLLRVLIVVKLALGFVGQPRPRRALLRPTSLGAVRDLTDPAVEAVETVLDRDARECSIYWSRYSTVWAQPLALLDVQMALLADELQGVSDIAHAVDQLEARELDVRRRFRGLSAAALLPRWRVIAARRDQLRAAGLWDAALRCVPSVRSYCGSHAALGASSTLPAALA